jgi:ATP/maltotriose-dependent transcriptional regulator MalT
VAARQGIDCAGRGWWGGHVAGPAGFVGRQRELSLLRAALGGDARLLLVAGDAGVGKTRLVAEAMRLAGAEGTLRLWGGCLPLAEKLPLLPVREALGGLARVEGGRVLEAALAAAPRFASAEMQRLLPELGDGVGEGDVRGEAWRRDRLFAAVGEVLAAVAGRCPVGLVVEDVHWADGATLDLLTFLARAGRGSVVLLVTCRSDEAPLDPVVAGWLAHVRGSEQVEEIRLGPLSPAESALHLASLAGGQLPERVAGELYARAEGNPFFTEQLVAATLAGPSAGSSASAAGLPARLADLLLARASGCGSDARRLLEALAVAGRPLTDDLLTAMTGLTDEAARAGLRELAAARLLAEGMPGGACRPRHALLAEAVAAGLLPGERARLHERAAEALAAAGDESLAAEVAGHWAAAGRGAEELPARVAAAEAAERVSGYADAASHWQRAIELSEALPGAAGQAGTDLPPMYVCAVDAFFAAGDSEHARQLAAQAHERFANHHDPATAAVICQRAALLRGLEDLAAGLPLIEQALRLFDQAPPSADQAEAWLTYGFEFLLTGQGQVKASVAAFSRAREIAQAAGATALLPRILPWLGNAVCCRGHVDEGLVLVRQGRALAEDSADGQALLWAVYCESEILHWLAKFDEAASIALSGLQAARQAGREASFEAAALVFYAASSVLMRGRTAEAAALIDPVTAGPPDRDRWLAHECRVRIDLRRGDVAAAAERWQANAEIAGTGMLDWVLEAAQDAAELALWTGRPAEALKEARRGLALFTVPDLTPWFGRLLTAGMRACADLAEQARARKDQEAAAAANAATDGLADWVKQMRGLPFASHPAVAMIPAQRAVWDAEQTRLAGASDPAAWNAAASAWDDLGCPHEAGYARWRQAEANLAAGHRSAAVTALRAAAAAAGGHAPLQARIRQLAQLARIPLADGAPAAPAAPRQADTPGPFGLTGRELTVLGLIAAGRTNSQIGAELYISARTASVHVTNILRKLGVSSRVQAAALAERAGLVDTSRP